MTDPIATTQADSGGSYVTALEHAETGQPGKQGKPRSLWSDAWHDLRRRPLFIIAAIIILFLIVVSIFPSWFTSADPNYRDLSRSRATPTGEAWFGYDVQGQDVFARAVYGTRWSLLVGLGAAVFTVLIGGTIGLIGGYFGGALDGVLSRVAEVFFGLPFVLGAIVILNAFRSSGVDSAPALVGMVVVALSLLSWPVAMRIMRSAAISAKQQDYVKAARALGASPGRIIFRHMLPNCMAPLLVYATILLGSFIAVEATLSFLGIGLRDPAVSWGVMIADARNYIRVAPHLMLFPAGILALTVLAFVMLGDAVRDALDPKLR
ncbi:ABC transporter permease [Actinophytocola sediminis]